jgi:sugar lactone lactonase YvrE
LEVRFMGFSNAEIALKVRATHPSMATFRQACFGLRPVQILIMIVAVAFGSIASAQTTRSNSVKFGSFNIGGERSSPASMVFTFERDGTIGSTAVLTQGAKDLDFRDAGTGSCMAGTAYHAGETCTVAVTFQPKAAGTRNGAVQLLDRSGNVLATGFMQGTGIGAQVKFLPGTQITMGKGILSPSAIVVDGNGDAFVADAGSNAVYRIPAAGGYSTAGLLGSGFRNPSGLAIDAGGNLFVADTGNNAVKEILASSGYSTIKTVTSELNAPRGIAVDGNGNLFVANSGKNEIKEFLAEGGYTTIKTLGQGFANPSAVAVDGIGNLFVADTGNNAVKELLASSGYSTIKTVGSAFQLPKTVSVGGDGNVFVADGKSNSVYEIPSAGGYALVNKLDSGVVYPSGISVDERGNVFVVDQDHGQVSKLDYADPPSLKFDATELGSAKPDSQQTVTVHNIGNAPLSFSEVKYPVDFPESPVGDESECTSATTLAPGGHCTLTIDFVPQSGGSLSEYVSLTDNALHAGTSVYATQLVPLISGGNSGDATITSPAPGSAFSSTSATFTWTAGTGASAYALCIGTRAVGTCDVLNVTTTKAMTWTVKDLPINGKTVYVRLRTDIGGVWSWIDYTYTAWAPTLAAITSPTPGAKFTSSSATFTWSAGATTNYALCVGTRGVGTCDLENLTTTTALSQTVTGLPTNGTLVYVRLRSAINGVWAWVDYTYTAVGSPTPSALLTPTPGSKLSASTVTFTWSAGSGVKFYELWLGTTGPGSSNLYNPGETTALSASVSSLPTNGENIYARMWSYINNVWQSTDYMYTASGSGTPAAAVIMSPTPGTTLLSTSTFTWSTGTEVAQYALCVGTRGTGTCNISNVTNTFATSLTVSGIPTTGTVNVRLRSEINGVWSWNDYTYSTSAPAPTMITSPTPGSTLTGSPTTFTWAAGNGISSYTLCVGTKGIGTCDLYDLINTKTLSASVKVPTDGVIIYVRLHWVISGVSSLADYTYTASGSPTLSAISSPTPGTKLSAAPVTFTWTAGMGVTQYELWVGTAKGAHNLLYTGGVTTLSAVVPTLPTNGEPIYARMWSYINAAWQYTDYTYTAPGAAATVAPVHQ